MVYFYLRSVVMLGLLMAATGGNGAVNVNVNVNGAAVADCGECC